MTFARTYLENLTAPNSKRSQTTAVLQVALLLWPDAFNAKAPRSENLEIALNASWESLDYQRFCDLKLALQKKVDTSSARHYLGAARRVMREGLRTGDVSPEKYASIQQVVIPKQYRQPSGRSVDADEMQKLAASFDRNEAKGARDAVILAFLYLAGLRRHELGKARLSDLNLKTGELHVIGKRGKERTVWIPKSGMVAMKDWLRFRGNQPGPIVYPLTWNHKLILSRKKLSPDSIMRAIIAVAESAEIGRLRPHDLRRTFVSDHLDAGTDLVLVQRLAGHDSPATTARYDRRPDRASAAASKRLEIDWSNDV